MARLPEGIDRLKKTHLKKPDRLADLTLQRYKDFLERSTGRGADSERRRSAASGSSLPPAGMLREKPRDKPGPKDNTGNADHHACRGLPSSQHGAGCLGRAPAASEGARTERGIARMAAREPLRVSGHGGGYLFHSGAESSPKSTEVDPITKHITSAHRRFIYLILVILIVLPTVLYLMNMIKEISDLPPFPHQLSSSTSPACCIRIYNMLETSPVNHEVSVSKMVLNTAPPQTRHFKGKIG